MPFRGDTDYKNWIPVHKLLPFLDLRWLLGTKIDFSININQGQFQYRVLFMKEIRIEFKI